MKEGREERLQRKIDRRNEMCETWEAGLDNIEKNTKCECRSSEIDFARQQIAKSYLEASISEVD